MRTENDLEVLDLSEDERALLLAWPETSHEVDELSMSRALGWPPARVRAAMLSLTSKGLANMSPPKPMQWTWQRGRVHLWAAFRCVCGKYCAMGDQENGNAAMAHESPRCEAFDAITDQRSAIAYFASLPAVELTADLERQLQRTCLEPS